MGTDARAGQEELPPQLRFLKVLVTVLTGTMILGLLAIVFLLVTRLPQTAAIPALPPAITLPEGTAAEAVTFGKGWVAVVTAGGGEILVYDAATGALRARVPVAP